MRFIDQVDIQVSSGSGGDGQVSFRREKYIPRGGPDGGSGGNGGSVFIHSCQGQNTLAHYRGIKSYKAQNGEAGAGSQKNGQTGQDLVLKVPVGTIVRARQSGQIIGDLAQNGQRVLIVQGGRGGLGNVHFKSSINQAPRHAQKGDPAAQLELRMELKLLADLALVGAPNAGKSTLISAMSAARPKVADYPFTTLTPHLGVVTKEQQSWVVADIPGLVERAHQGRGLGTTFLKHIERTRALIHLVDISDCEQPYQAFERYVDIRQELSQYGRGLQNKRELICLSKADALNKKEIAHYQDLFSEQLDKKVLPISAVSGKNIDMLKSLMMQILEMTD